MQGEMAMSCCGRQASEHAQVPQRRQALERLERDARAGGANPGTGPGAPAPAGPPPRLVFKGRHPLSLPVGTRRILVLPGQVVETVTPAERAALWRTGLFE
jgi:hypothetical protein